MYSIVMPSESERFPLFLNTLNKYNELCDLTDVEFILPSRTMTSRTEHPFGATVKVINYIYPTDQFNPCMALNIGVRNAKYDRVIITCPEVMPETDCLGQFGHGNEVAKVWDIAENGRKTQCLVSSRIRQHTPGFYFLAKFNKKDIELIN